MSAFLLTSAAMCIVALALLLPVVWRRADSRGAAFVLTGVLVAVFAIGSMLTYPTVSNWVWDEETRAQATDDAMRRMATDAEAQLQLGDDLQGWQSLARFYMNLQDYEGAARAFGRAWQLSGERDIGLAVAYGEALALADLDNLQGRAGELMETALEAQPNNARALWYGGLAAYERGHFSVARQRWTRLLQMDPPASIRQLLVEQLAAIENVPDSAGAGTAGPPTVAPGSPAGPPAPAVGGENDDAAGITVDIELADDLQQRVEQGAALFLIARASGQGPPLAVQRLDPGQLPGSFALGQGDVMLPNQRLADASELHVTARISQRGDATSRSGDLYGELRLEPGGSGRIVIDQVVP